MQLLPHQERHVPIGHKKVRVSVCWTAQANGKKLKPFIVFGNAKREPKALNDEFGHKCAIKFIPNAWMR